MYVYAALYHQFCRPLSLSLTHCDRALESSIHISISYVLEMMLMWSRVSMGVFWNISRTKYRIDDAKKSCATQTYRKENVSARSRVKARNRARKQYTNFYGREGTIREFHTANLTKEISLTSGSFGAQTHTFTPTHQFNVFCTRVSTHASHEQQKCMKKSEAHRSTSSVESQRETDKIK